MLISGLALPTSSNGAAMLCDQMQLLPPLPNFSCQQHELCLPVFLPNLQGR